MNILAIDVSGMPKAELRIFYYCVIYTEKYWYLYELHVDCIETILIYDKAACKATKGVKYGHNRTTQLIKSCND